MDRKLSDEQIDRIAKNLLQDFALKDDVLDEIAGAPQLWRNVRNQIEAEKARREKSRFGWLRAPRPAFAAAAILICGALAFSILNFADNSTAALENPVENQPPQIAQAAADSPIVSPEVVSKNPENPKRQSAANISPSTVARQNKFVAKTAVSENPAKSSSRPSKTKITPETTVAETKTDFIALSYAANTESGQIVRVRVPSSMMVTLGVKTEVADEAALVSAEVVIGDDGLARAIRFIR